MAQCLIDHHLGAHRRHDRGQFLGHSGQTFLPGTDHCGKGRVITHPGTGRHGLVALQQAERQFRGQRVGVIFGGQRGQGGVDHLLTHSRSFSRLRRSQLRTVFSGAPSRSAISA